MTNLKNWHGKAIYLIKVRGRLGSRWSDWFGGMKVESEGEMTILTGEISDQPALHALLIRIRDLGLPLISVKRVESE